MMFRRVAALIVAGGLMLIPAGAHAEVYRVIEGELRDFDSGESRPLIGEFDASLVDPSQLFGSTTAVLILDDFKFESGDQVFTPAPPLEFDGLRPISFLEIADQVQIAEEEVEFLRVRAGGEVIAASGDEVVFRFFEFRAGTGSGSRAIGSRGESEFPRRLALHGTLHEVDQTFRILDERCLVFPLPPTDPGGLIGGGAVFVAASALPPPTLDELGITAPEGATVTFDDDGILTVTSEGDLIIQGGVIDIPGMTALVIQTAGEITIAGSIIIPEGVTLDFDTTRDVVLEDPDLLPIGLPLCGGGLRPSFPAQEREIGSFSLLVSAALQMDVDVKPRRRNNRVLPLRRVPLPLAILGSEEFDVRDIDEDSLRIGRGEANSIGRGAFRNAIHRDLNRDGYDDLLIWVDVREAAVAYGDTVLCVFGETNDGITIEGCDAIDTRPRTPRPPLGAGRRGGFSSRRGG